MGCAYALNILEQFDDLVITDVPSEVIDMIGPLRTEDRASSAVM